MTTRRRRTLFLVIAATAAVAAAVPLLRPLVTRMAADRARTDVTARAMAGLRAPISLGRVELSFLPTVLVLHDLRLDSDGAFGLRAGSTLERLEVRGSARALLAWGSRPVDMYVERPDFAVVLPGAALPGAGPPAAEPPGALPAATGGTAFPPGSTLEVRNGHIRAEAPGGVTIECDGFGLDTAPAAAPVQVAGRLLCARGSLRSPLGNLDSVEGQAGFEWGSGRLRLDPVIVHADGFDLSARGTVEGTEAAPRAEMHASLGFELAKVAPLLPPDAAPAGRVDLKVEGSLDGARMHGTGTLAAPVVRLYGFEATEARAAIVLGDTLRMQELEASLLGGRLTGDIDLARRDGGWEARAAIDAERLDAARILALVSWGGPPVDGVVGYRGRHTLDSAGLVSLSGGGELTVAGAFRTAQGERRPFETRSTLTTTGRSVAIADGTIRAGAVEGRFDGQFSPSAGLSLRLRGGAGTLADLLPLFRMATPRPPARRGAAAAPATNRAALRSPGGPLLPVRLIAWQPAPAEDPLQTLAEALGGRWEWDGDLRFDSGGLRFEGNIAGNDLTWHGTDLGSLTADINYGDGRLLIRHLLMRAAGGGVAAVSGEVDFRPPGRLTLEGDLQDVPLPLLLALAGVALPVEGTTSGHLTIDGELASPAVGASIATGPLGLYGLTWDGLRGGVQLHDGLLRASNVILSRGAGQVRVDGSLAIDDAAVAAAAATVEARGIDLAAIGVRAGEVAITGLVDADARLTGRLRSPSGHVAIRGAGVRFGGFDAGDVTLDADLEAGVARITAAVPARSLALSGRVGMEAGLPVDLALEVSDLTLTGPELVQGVPDDVTLALALQATIAGPAARPRELTARATAGRARIAVAGATASAESPVEAELRDGRLTMRPAVLTGVGTRIDLNAGVDLDPEGRVDLDAHGKFDLALIRTFVRGLQAEGEGDIQLSVAGPRRDPSFRGSLVMQAPRVRYPDLPFPIDGLDADIAFDGISGRIRTLQFTAGGGLVHADGEVLLGTSGVSHGLASILAADIGIRGRGVNAEFPAGFRSLSNLDLRLVYDPTGAELSGTVDVVRGVYSRNFRIESSLLTGKPPALFDLHPPAGPLAALRLDLALHAPGQIWVRNDFGRIEGQAELRVGGTAERPAVTGRVTALEGSTIDFNRVRYRLSNGTIDFNDPEAINPVFNLNAETSVEEYQVTLQVEGTVDKFSYQLTSNPPLSQSDIVSLLLTGRTIGGLGTNSASLSPEYVSAYLAGQLSQQISSRFFGRVAPDVIAIDPMQAAAQGDATTRLTLAKQITPDLRVTYTDVLGTNQGAAYQVDYHVGRNISFSSERSGTGSIGGDFRYVLEGRSPPPPGGAIAGPGVVKPIIVSARVEGESVLPPERILAKLHLKPGKRRDQARLLERLDKLLDRYHSKGYLMAELDVKETPVEPSGVDMRVSVRAGQRVRLDIEGVGGAGALRDQVEPQWQQAIFLEDTIEDTRERIAGLVADRGWRRATVKAQVIQNDPALIHVRFDVDPGPRARVAEVRVEGTKQITTDEALHPLKTKPDGAFNRGIVRGDRLRADQETLQTLYLSRGFARADVDPAQVDLDAEGEHAVVTFHVHEGPRVSVRHTLFEGGSGMTEERLVEAVAMPEGVPFVREGAEGAAARLRRAYDGSGWPDARVRWRADRSAGDDEAEEDDLTFTIEPGMRQSVAEVSIGGNVITDDGAIRRQLTIAPEVPLSRADLLASQTRLYRLGVFRSVDIRPVEQPKPPAPLPAPASAAEPPASATATEPPATEPAAPEPVPAEPVERPVQIAVQEAPPLRQSFGIGYDTFEKFRGLYEIAYRNLFGSARYLGLQMRASDVEQRASILYREQGVFGARYDLLGSAFGIDEQRPSFTGTTVGIAAELSREVGRATKLRYRYALKDVNPSESTVDFEGSTLRLASLAASGAHDTRDQPFGPLRGHYFAADLLGYGRAIGSQAQFAKFYAQAFTFKEVLPRTVWAQAIRVGAAITYGQSKSDPTSTGDSESGVPKSERFYAGGDTTLRGFSLDLAGPLDSDGKPFGGEGLFILNEELRFPIWSKLQGVVFTDIGNVYRTLSDYSLRDLRECIGAGLRLMTPIGPFRMEYGALLDRQPGEDPGQFFISIGQAF